MIGLGKRKKKKENNRNTRSGLPVARYHSSKKPDSLRASSDIKRVSRDRTRSAPSRIKETAVHLPQVMLIVVIVLILLANTTLSSLGLKMSAETDFSYRSSGEYQAGIEDVFNRSLLNKSKITFSSSSFEEELSREFPELVSSSAVVPLLGRKLQIGLGVSPALVRLSSSFEGANGAVVTSSGVLVRPASSSTSNLVSLTMQPSVDHESGDKILTTSEIELVALLMAELDGSGPHRPKVDTINFSVTSREMRIRFINEDYFVKVTPESDPHHQIGALIATLQQLTKEQGGDRPVIDEYVDARVGERVFVK